MGEPGVGYVAYPAKDLGRLKVNDETPRGSPAPPTLTGSFRDITAEFFKASESTISMTPVIMASFD